MIVETPLLKFADEHLEDGFGKLTVNDIAPALPENNLKLKNVSPMISTLWQRALADCESNIVESESGVKYFGAGTRFATRVYTRDISYSGILGLNRIYPEIMRNSLLYTRDVRLQHGFNCPVDYALEELNFKHEDCTEKEFLNRTTTNTYSRRTDDVCWIWAYSDLIERTGNDLSEWQYLYNTAVNFFANFYNPMFDKTDGLYRGQATFIDIHFSNEPGVGKSSGYPQDWKVIDCLKIKTTSTNALYYKALTIMAKAATILGKDSEALNWQKQAENLKQAIRNNLRNADGTFAYFKHTDGTLEKRREALGTAFPILFDIVTGEEARQAVANYPITGTGVPLFLPFFPWDKTYHNNAAWPFVDSFFIKAYEKACNVDLNDHMLALLGRTCRPSGTFHEVVDFRTAKIHGSPSQLWSSSGFIGRCLDKYQTK